MALADTCAFHAAAGNVNCVCGAGLETRSGLSVHRWQLTILAGVHCQPHDKGVSINAARTHKLKISKNFSSRDRRKVRVAQARFERISRVPLALGSRTSTQHEVRRLLLGQHEHDHENLSKNYPPPSPSAISLSRCAASLTCCISAP